MGATLLEMSMSDEWDQRIQDAMDELNQRRILKDLDRSLEVQVDVSNDLLDEVRDVLMKYNGKVTTPVVIGVLESMKFEILLNDMTATEIM